MDATAPTTAPHTRGGIYLRSLGCNGGSLGPGKA